MQRDIAFSASFNVLYLVDSEKSVTHTGASPLTSLRTRVKRRAYL